MMTTKGSLRWACMAASMALFALVACGNGDKYSQIAGSQEGVGALPALAKPAEKVAAGGPVVIFARVTQNGLPSVGVTVAFSRSVSGQPENYMYTGNANADGQAEIAMEGAGYYRARVTDDVSGAILGEWGSIPINTGKAQVILLPVGARATVHASRFTAVYAFGDSYVDNGDFYAAAGGTYPPDPPYWNGRWTNGENFVDVLAQNLGLNLPTPSSSGGTNYGFGGATVAVDWDYDGILIRSVKTQVEDFVSRLGGNRADPRALYVFFAGGSDVFGAVDEGLDGTTGADPVSKAARDLVAQMGILKAHGAVHFLVLNQYDMAILPLPGYHGNQAVTDLCAVFNQALAAGLDGLGGHIVQFDFDKVVQQMMGDFQYTDVIYLDQESPGDPDDYLIFDDWGHFTARANRLLGDACTVAVLPQMVSKR